jgi:hypothetical protein
MPVHRSSTTLTCTTPSGYEPLKYSWLSGTKARPALEYLAEADIQFDDRLDAANRLATLTPVTAVRALHTLIEDYWGDPDWLDWCKTAAQALTDLGDPLGRQITGELSAS